MSSCFLPVAFLPTEARYSFRTATVNFASWKRKCERNKSESILRSWNLQHGNFRKHVTTSTHSSIPSGSFHIWGPIGCGFLAWSTTTRGWCCSLHEQRGRETGRERERDLVDWQRFRAYTVTNLLNAWYTLNGKLRHAHLLLSTSTQSISCTKLL